MGLNKNYETKYEIYNKYLQDYEAYLKKIHGYINAIYDQLNVFVGKDGYWLDDNAVTFIKWFRANCNSADSSYESAYKTILSVLTDSGLKESKRIKSAQQQSYSKYSFIKKYANAADIYGALGDGKYKATKIKNTLGTTPNAAKAVGNKEKVNACLTKIKAIGSDLDDVSQALAQKVLRYSARLEGGSGTGVTAAHARLILRMSVFTKEMKKQLEAAMEKSNLM